MFCCRLEAEGVPAFVAHEFHVGNVWHYWTALNGGKVQVNEEQSAEARSMESRSRGREFRSLLESEFGSMDNVHIRTTCPDNGCDFLELHMLC